MIASGRLPAWTCKIRPFYDRPDIEQDFLLYSVPADAEEGPTTVFTDRFWDHMENWVPPGVGTVPGSEKPYFGPVPAPGITPVVGDDDWWLNGFSYETFQAGGYPSGGCCPVKSSPPLRIRQAQRVLATPPYRPWLGQVQSIVVAPPAPLFQFQALNALQVVGRPGDMAQAQKITFYSGVIQPAPMSQGQNPSASKLTALPAPIRQAQNAGMVGHTTGAAPLAQAQDVTATEYTSGPAAMAQAQALSSTSLIALLVELAQAQDVTEESYVAGHPSIRQAQDATSSGHQEGPADLAQAQNLHVAGGSRFPADLAQAQDTSATSVIGLAVTSGQAQDTSSLTSAGHDPGTTCATAGPLTLSYVIPYKTPSGVDSWWEIPSVAAGAYTLELTVEPGHTLNLFVYEGSCSSLTVLAHEIATASTPFTHSVTGSLWIRVATVTTGVAYTVAID